jgi:hypothetical protein
MNLFRLLSFSNKQKREAEGFTSIMCTTKIFEHIDCKLSTLHQELKECCLLCIIRERGGVWVPITIADV